MQQVSLNESVTFLKNLNAQKTFKLFFIFQFCEQQANKSKSKSIAIGFNDYNSTGY